MATKTTTKKAAEAKHYSVLVRPVFSEKAAGSTESPKSVVSFIVDRRASKPEIKEAVERVFGVTVTAVRTMNYMGKPKKTTGILGRRAAFKKAYITLAEGEKIQLIEGL
jgi:large subunit ribosomal protein L23